MSRVILLSFCLSLIGCQLRTRALPPPRDGVYHKENHQIGGRQYSSDEYYENGEIKREIIYFESGKKSLERTLYKSADRVDSSMSFFESGSLRVLWLSRENKNILHRSYYENGNIEVWGDSSGIREAFYENGQKKYALVWIDNEVREKKGWHSNGIMKEFSEWKNDAKNGKFFLWDSTGKQIRKEIYKDGKKK